MSESFEDQVRQRLARIKALSKNENHIQNETQVQIQSNFILKSISISFPELIQKSMQQDLNPWHLFEMIKSCYLILKWILIEKQITMKKHQIPFQIIIVNYFMSNGVQVSEDVSDQSKIQFDGKNADRSSLAQIALYLKKSYIDFILNNRDKIHYQSPRQFYSVLKKNQENFYLKKYKFVDSLDSSSPQSLLYLSDYETHSGLKTPKRLITQASIQVEDFFYSIIKSTSNISQDQVELVQNEIQIDLQRYRIAKKSKDSFNEQSIFSNFNIEIILSLGAYLVFGYYLYSYLVHVNVQ